MVNRKLSGYFSVEAALVVPFAIAAVVTVVYLTIYQYDRCIIEQDLIMVSVYAAAMNRGDDGENRLQRRVSEVDITQYLNCRLESFQVELAGNTVKSTVSGTYLYPIPGWNWFTGQAGWQMETFCEMKWFSPEKILRGMRKIKEVFGDEN